mmetsp:Transcript_65424/g.185552  ORF Transcript_65424/g.185552 Transcript_65424/m.185552 type:complete len:201 (+) Transcript_65424:80-682(+)
MTRLPAFRSTPPARSSACRSSWKSSSWGSDSPHSSANFRKSRSGYQNATWLATMESVLTSSRKTRSTPSCWTLTATTSPVLRSRARWTCAMLAEAMGSGSKLEKRSRGGRRRSLRIVRRTSSMELTGRWSVRERNSLVWGSGRTPTMALMTWPALMKSPFACSACSRISLAFCSCTSFQSLSCSGPGPRASDLTSTLFSR